MRKKEITERYEANIHLNTLYDVLTSLQGNNKCWYPEDINNDVTSLIKKINNHIYHNHSGYDVIDETWYSEITFEKNMKDVN